MGKMFVSSKPKSLEADYDAFKPAMCQNGFRCVAVGGHGAHDALWLVLHSSNFVAVLAISMIAKVGITNH